MLIVTSHPHPHPQVPFAVKLENIRIRAVDCDQGYRIATGDAIRLATHISSTVEKLLKL